jgi:hypothetical protein
MTAEWNVEKARRLYDQDKVFSEIGEACNVSKSAVVGYAKRHWPAREIDKERHDKYFNPKRGTNKTEARPAGKITLPPLPSLTYLDET